VPQFLELSAEDQRLTIEQTAARNGWAVSSVRMMAEGLRARGKLA
jgi:hypothetical protein